jgi:hypothetical protein
MMSPHIGTSAHHQPKFRLLFGSKPIVFTMFMALALATPHASATCINQNLARHVPQPLVAAPLADAITPQPLVSIPAVSNSIVGLWNVNFLSGGQVVDVAFDAWHGDQTEILNDYTDPIEGNVCLGVWVEAGNHTYKLKHPSWVFDSNGTLLGTEILRETVKLNGNGQSYTGAYTLDIYDVSGNFVEEFSGSLKATRINVD